MIIGLGNPGQEYQKTRHNIGYMVVDRVAQQFDAQFKKGRGAYDVARVRVKEYNAILASRSLL